MSVSTLMITYLPGIFVPRNESSRGRMFHGSKVPWNIRPRERKFPGTKVPGNKSSTLFVPGTKVLRDESSIIHKAQPSQYFQVLLFTYRNTSILFLSLYRRKSYIWGLCVWCFMRPALLLCCINFVV